MRRGDERFGVLLGLDSQRRVRRRNRGHAPDADADRAGMTFNSIVAGNDFTCALTTAGAAYCWGLGPLGQLGDGTSTNSTTPVPVAGGLTFRSLAAGGQAVCGLTTEGKAYCWGNNFYGTVGDGTSGMDRRPDAASDASRGGGRADVRDPFRRVRHHVRRDRGRRGLLLGIQLRRGG